MRTVWQGLFVISFFTAACSSGNTGPTFDVADQDFDEGLIQQLTEAFNAKDAKKAAALYTPEAAVMPPNKSLSRGRDFVEQYYTARFAEGASDLTLTPSEIKGAGNLGVAIGDYRLTLAPPQGPQRRDRGKFVWIFREQNNAWMIDTVIFSSDFAVPPPA